MRNIFEQRMFRLPPDLWPALERLAAATNSVAKRGPTARKPSISVMLERIALGEITVAEREPWSLPPGLAEAVALEDERQREQSRLEEQRRRITEQAKPQHKTPVKLEQMNMLDLEPA
jgi:hypothetical protein